LKSQISWVRNGPVERLAGIIHNSVAELYYSVVKTTEKNTLILRFLR